MVIKSIGSCIDDFYSVEKLGHGGFATVFKAQCKKEGYENNYVAIKQISKRYIQEKKLKQLAKQEIEIHSNLKHPNIVELFTTFEDKDNIYLILELCSGGSLEDVLKKKGPLNEIEAHNIFKQVVEGVKYLHNIENVIHRDISLRNILLTSDQTVKIADFGLSAQLAYIDQKKRTVVGTPHYMAPEVVTKDPHSVKRDCWSLGCVLFALLDGKLPFDAKHKHCSEVLTDIVMKPITFPEKISSEAMDLISHLLEKDPEKRIGINAVLEHDFFKKYENSPSQKGNGDSGTGSMSGSSVKIQSKLNTYSKNSRRSYRTLDSGMDSSHYESTESRKNDKFRNNKCLDTIHSSGCSYHSTDNKLKKDAKEVESRIKYTIIKAEKNSYTAKESSKKSRSFGLLKNSIQTLPSMTENVPPMYNSIPNHRKILERSNSTSSLKKSSMSYEASKNRVNSHERSVSEERQKQIRYHKGECPNYLDYADKENKISENSRPNLYQKNNHHSTPSCFSSSHDYENKNICKDRYCRFEKPLTVDNYNNEYLLTSNCSHNMNCRYENNHSSHEMSCPCQKKTSNLNKKHTAAEIHKKPPKEIMHMKSLNQVMKPLSTIRLQPMRKITRNAAISISKDGCVWVEHLKKQYVSSVCQISVDGQRMCVFKPGIKCHVSDKPPPIPRDRSKIEWFTFDSFPKVHFKLYFWAKKTVDILRAKTAKITIFGKMGKCVMMENGPNPDYEMDFYNGEMLKKTCDKVSYVDEKGQSYLISVDENWNQNCVHLQKEFVKMQKQCERIEEQLEPLEKSGVRVFPIISGNQPIISNSANEYEENMSSHSHILSWLKKDSNKLASVDNVHHSYSSKPGEHLFAQSYLQNSKLVERSIDDIRNRLKTDPKVIDNAIVADYKAGYQLKILMNSGDVCFIDPQNNKELIPNHALKERLKQDFLGILSHVKKKSKLLY